MRVLCAETPKTSGAPQKNNSLNILSENEVKNL
jgi:hypothetical protein